MAVVVEVILEPQVVERKSGATTNGSSGGGGGGGAGLPAGAGGGVQTPLAVGGGSAGSGGAAGSLSGLSQWCRYRWCLEVLKQVMVEIASPVNNSATKADNGTYNQVVQQQVELEVTMVLLL